MHTATTGSATIVPVCNGVIFVMVEQSGSLLRRRIATGRPRFEITSLTSSAGRAPAPGRYGLTQILDGALFSPGRKLLPAGRFTVCKQILNTAFFQATLAQSNIAADRSDHANSVSRLLTSLSDISISL